MAKRGQSAAALKKLRKKYGLGEFSRPGKRTVRAKAGRRVIRARPTVKKKRKKAPARSYDANPKKDELHRWLMTQDPKGEGLFGYPKDFK